MADPLTYAVIERERRFLVARIPAGVVDTIAVEDHYLDGSRLRLRRMTHSDGSVVRKLGQKRRLDEGPAAVACTTTYLDEQEWDLLRRLPSRDLRKTRHIVERDGLRVAVDELADGSLLAEIDDRDGPVVPVPHWLEVLRDVSADERWTGAAIARGAGGARETGTTDRAT